MSGTFRALLPWQRATKYQRAETIPFVLAHVVCLAAIWTGVDGSDIAIAVGLYALRMFAVTAGYHRYFSHRTFRTSRAFQFVLAFLAQTSAQRGALWWAANHRSHHRHSDTSQDAHSPVQHGFWHAHLGWFFTKKNDGTDFDSIRDLAKYPELRWLNKHHYIPAIALGFVVWLLAGWSGLVVGFFWSTVALWHATFSINSLAHVVGRKRYVTGDQSRNNWWLALLTFGEGWHNNHHHYQSAARQGFSWYEIDISFYVLKALAAFGLVWDLRLPPSQVVCPERPLHASLVEKSAAQLAASFHVERIAAELHALLAGPRSGLDGAVHAIHDNLAACLEEWRHNFHTGVETGRHNIENFIGAMHLPPMPSLHDLEARARAMFARTPSMNDIVGRARQILAENVLQAMVGNNSSAAAARP